MFRKLFEVFEQCVNSIGPPCSVSPLSLSLRSKNAPSSSSSFSLATLVRVSPLALFSPRPVDQLLRERRRGKEHRVKETESCAKS